LTRSYQGGRIITALFDEECGLRIEREEFLSQSRKIPLIFAITTGTAETRTRLRRSASDFAFEPESGTASWASAAGLTLRVPWVSLVVA
jgi:hypothetical protein